MSNRSTRLVACALVALGVGAAIIAYFRFVNKPRLEPTPERIAFLVTEMTANASRQQLAMDEIVKLGEPAIVQLFPYLHDNRALATNNIKFLNTHSPSTERYFLTLATTVDELTLRYLCWKTKACDFGFDEKDPANRNVQLNKLESHCRARFPDLESRCRTIVDDKVAR